MNSLCADIGYMSLNKYNEQLCGDHVEVVINEDDSKIIVLADGLGSGVKANILAILTSKIISTMIANGLPVEECVSTIASTLPICKVRHIAYSTFTIITINQDDEAEIIQFDNPWVIMLRDGKIFQYTTEYKQIEGKDIYMSKIPLHEDDLFIAVSDGVIHAGVGLTLNFGWQRKDVIKFLENIYYEDITANEITTLLLNQCDSLYCGKPGDDTTVCTVKLKKRKPLNIMIGPPLDPKDDLKMLLKFFSNEGKHVVCGGTTASIVANFLEKELEVGFPVYIDPEIPPIAKIDGVDLVTEGVVTFSKVLEYAKDYLSNDNENFVWQNKNDGASIIARLLFNEATNINFFVGRAVNSAHQNPDLPIGFNIKMRLVEDLSDCLQKMGKNIKVSYF